MVMLGVMNTLFQIILKVGTVIELIQVVKIMKMINHHMIDQKMIQKMLIAAGMEMAMI